MKSGQRSRKFPTALLILLALLWPALALAQGPAYSRAVPTIARPTGSPDPAARVRRLSGSESPPLRAPVGNTSDGALYRRLGDGSFAAITAPGYVIVNSGCPSLGALDTRARMIELAAAEWAWFGFPTFDVTGAPETALPRRDGLEIVEPAQNLAIGERALRRALRLGLMEDDAAVRPTIAGYWAASRSDDALRIQALVNYADRDAGWSQPWSAAFVSWLACEAGLSSQQFRRSGRHYDYVRAAVAARDGQDPLHAFVAYDLGEAPPVPGDLICAARAGSEFASLADIRGRQADESTALHCDLVVKADPARGRLYSIGGNVGHAVTLSVLSTDAAGRPLPDLALIGASRWFAVLKFRGVPDPLRDLDCTPTVLGLAAGYRNYAAAVGAGAAAPVAANTGPGPTGCAR